MLRVSGQIHALSVTLRVAKNARETAVTSLALAGGERRGHANLSASAAIVDVAVGVDA